MPVKHIYWFTYYDLSEPSVRYRCKYPLEELEQHYNLKYLVIYPGYSITSICVFIYCYIKAFFSDINSTLIVFQKIRTNRLYAAALKLLLIYKSKNTIYDIDDAEYLQYSKRTINFFIRNSSICTVGSTALQEYALKHNNNILLQTSPIIKHNIVKQNKSDVFTIGWIGYYNAHKQSLAELLYPALKQVSLPTRVMLVGVCENEAILILNQFRDLKNIIWEIPTNIDWQNESSVYEMIKVFDVGIAPLLSSERNNCKSAFKTKQYLSCGVPVLATAVGENINFVHHGINGYICNTPEEFYNQAEAIRNMNTAEYNELMQNAISSSSNFTLEHYCENIMNYLNAEQLIQNVTRSH